MSRSRQNTSVTMMNRVKIERPMRFARYCTMCVHLSFLFEIQIRIEYRKVLHLESDLQRFCSKKEVRKRR